jgi:hypothetical protein
MSFAATHPAPLFQQSYARPRPRAETLAFGLCGGVDEGSKPIFSTRKSSSHLDQSTRSNVQSNFRNHPCFSHSTVWHVEQLRIRRRLLGPKKDQQIISIGLSVCVSAKENWKAGRDVGAVQLIWEGWPLLTVETEANGNSWSTNERGPSC